MNKEQSGKYPFTRGIYSEMYKKRLWTMRQYAGFSTAEESNQRYRYLLEQGTTGLSVAFDLPTQMGYDSDHPFSEGEVGKVGVPIDTLADIEILFRDIPLEKISTSMTINATAPILLAMHIAFAEKQGVDISQLRGTIQNDILKEYIARGTYIFPPKHSMRLITDVFEYCGEFLPRWNTISISGYHIREAGSTAAQELGFTFANGIEYVKSALACGLDVNKFGARLSFFFNAHNNFLEEVAKFRAARRLWAKIMKEQFGATEHKAQMCRFHVQTGGSTLTAQQIDNNIVRVTLQALSAIFGGAQSLHTNARDEALALPTEESVRLALRTQQVIAFESGITEYSDPFGGSEVVENITNRLETEALAIIERIEKMGGAVSAIEQNFQQNEIAQSAYRYQKSIEKKKRIIVGVNQFQADKEVPQNLLEIDAEVTQKQRNALKRVKFERDEKAVKNTISALHEASKTNENLFPFILSAVKNYVTLGEISDCLRRVFGEYQEN